MDVVLSNMPEYLAGFLVTLRLLVISGIAAIIIGTIVAVFRISPIAALRTGASVYTEFVRNTPLTLVLFFCSVVLPMLGSRLPFEVAAIVGLSVYTSPFIAEALRSGINGVPLGQAEAARSLGLGFGASITHVVFPQAFRMVVPPLINALIALTKNTSVAGGFFVVELVAVGKNLANGHGDAVIPILVGVAIFYLIITVPLGLAAGRIERKLVMQR